MTTTSTPARQPRAPQQERGMQRMSQILDAAEQVIGEVGVDAASVQAIAERAGASMGSLYHFFPSKQAVIEALAERCITRVTEVNEANTSPAMIGLPLEPLFGQIVDAQVQLKQQLPCFSEVHDFVLKTPGGRDLRERMDRVLLDQVESFLGARMPGMPVALRRSSAHLAITMVHGVLEAIDQMPPEAAEPLVHELRASLVRYFEPYDRQYGRGA
ncbi:MAG: TetR/AcrR family transcriptional regulator [Gemmatimonadaceae bacterium]|nr:TetR/AcrR family transcriptional regulator [Gemmatimonadaceae bacterium]